MRCEDEAKKFQETHEVIWSLMFLGFHVGELWRTLPCIGSVYLIAKHSIHFVIHEIKQDRHGPQEHTKHLGRGFLDLDNLCSLSHQQDE